MANKRDLKKDINYVMGDIIEAVYIWELTNPSKETKESQSIIDDAIVGFDELIVKVNQRDLENAKAHFKAVNQDDFNQYKIIELNIKGDARLSYLLKNNLKLIYFSTGYVYEGKIGNYKETDPILPVNNYAWSKLGGECAVTMYKNSLILRITMCEKPFLHKYAFHDIEANFIFHEEVVKIIPKILNKTGIINVGGKIQSVYSFAKKTKNDVKKKSGKKLLPKNVSMNVGKLKKIMKW